MLLIQNAHIKTMAGADIPNGCLLVEDGKSPQSRRKLTHPQTQRSLTHRGGCSRRAAWRRTATSALTIRPCVGRVWITMRSLTR